MDEQELARPGVFADGPLTEQVFLDIATPPRVELFDDTLFVSPAPNLRHQRLSTRLCALLDGAAAHSGLEVHHSVNLRLRPGLITITDIVVTNDLDRDGLVIDARAVHLVCEITSPHTATIDGVLKMHHYAVAGIPWYLTIDEEGNVLRLHRLTEGSYSIAESGKVVNLVEPIVVTIDAAELLRRR
ncbi:Uma2 family endonuclease [Actinoplanes sp. TBRC 11911]|uniref:Uma2 family endonuclease n=1 Tax=Actinoplanes sp. TBRC 11911 TaxID=2729386 RepID=UPI00145CA9DF|nr:Uma2 family endonuclease [Actinoplanes sp. TBRC 11911]NMO50462.1 Uma2 family endonuclease [Actinoplanes sp. TBRC 11911]